ncbi:MAG: hypothetical protein AAFX08_10015 [Pseudomonadota bacterium]
MDATATSWLHENWELAATAAGSVLAAIVSLVGAFLSSRETRKQRALLTEQLRAEIDRASIEWGRDAISSMAEAGELALARNGHLREGEFERKRADVAAGLSALVDRGRLFFPNVDSEGRGGGKESAFQGHRPPILDGLIYAYYEVEAMGSGAPKASDSFDFIKSCRRLVVSELQAHLDPRRRNEVVSRIEHRREGLREEALDLTGKLGVLMDVRRPGLLASKKDAGWTDRIGPDERRKILHDYHGSGAA